jgi:hypothetical protein
MIRLFEHIKTGAIYIYVGEAICTTNSAPAGSMTILYKKDDTLFARDKDEFFEKFREVPSVW